VQRSLALRMHCMTVAVSPAPTLYRLEPRRPSLNVNFHTLLLSSKLMYRSVAIAVSWPFRTIWDLDISASLKTKFEIAFLAQSC